jgi:fibronectin type 3 domain-containing protein
MVCPFFVKAQTADIKQDTITWSATADTNLNTSETFSRNATFVTYGQSKVELVNGVKARVFTVTSIDGDWADLSQPGKLIYQITFRDLAGLITIVRDESGLTLTLDMSQSSSDGIKNQYSIDHYTAK